MSVKFDKILGALRESDSTGGSAGFPSETGQSGKFLSTNGSTELWKWAKIHTATNDPGSADEGELLYRTDIQALKIYTGGIWYIIAQVSFDSLWNSNTDFWNSNSMDWNAPS